MSIASELVKQLKGLGDNKVAEHSARFFKTGPGQYGEGDRFLGVRVPEIRRVVRTRRDLAIDVTLELLKSPFHEVRLFAVLVLVDKYHRGDDKLRAAVYQNYLDHTAHINNWDIVDASAHKIVGPHLRSRSRRPLHKLVKSASLWERRIAIMATLDFIKHDDYAETLALAEKLLSDPEDLIHKAVGWMLREVGNRDRAVEKTFLNQHYQSMPRTMLRYAIEKFPQDERRAYLEGSA